MADASKKRKPAKITPAKTRKSKAALPEIIRNPLNRKPAGKKAAAESVPLSLPNKVPSPLNMNEEEPKFFVGPVMQKFAETKTHALTHNYGDNRIVLMVRDPLWLHSYWELQQNKIDELRSEMGIDIFNRSKRILRVYDITGIVFTGLNANMFFDIEINDNSRNWYINIGTPNRDWCVDLGFLTPEGRFYVAFRSNTVTTPRDHMSEVIDEEWRTIDWEKMFALSGGFGIGKSSAEIKEIFKKRLREEMSSGCVSSFGKPAELQDKEQEFRLVANAELVVYGSTDPSAQLSVSGFPVKLRPDGSFTIRFALPEGRQEIPIVAVDSKGGQKKVVTPVVEKRTI